MFHVPGISAYAVTPCAAKNRALKSRKKKKKKVEEGLVYASVDQSARNIIKGTTREKKGFTTNARGAGELVVE